MDERRRLQQWLAELTDKAFAEFFYEAVQGREPGETGGHFVLADAGFLDGQWSVDFVGVHDPGQYDGPWADDAPICQAGECLNCGTDVRSWAKHAICPICRSTVYAT